MKVPEVEELDSEGVKDKPLEVKNQSGCGYNELTDKKEDINEGQEEKV